MRKTPQSIAPLVAVAIAMGGCASSAGGGGDQLQNTVYATHRLVQNLDRNLSASVTRLNETTAELVTRVESADRETRQLLSTVEENQVKLVQLQQRLDELTATLYRHLNLSPPSDMSRAPGISSPNGGPVQSAPLDVETGGVIVERPPQSAFPSAARGEIEDFPPVESINEGPAGADPDSYYIRAQDLYNAEQYDEALEQFDSYLRLFPNSPNVADAQYWKAHSYFKLKRYNQAIEEFRTLIAQYPGSGKVPIALHNQAVAQYQLGEVDAAIETFERLIREFPNDVVADMGREKLNQLRGL